METRDVDLSTMTLEQLQALHKSTDTDVKNLTSQLTSLRGALARFNDSIAALAAIPSDAPGAEVLVPMTSSLYVPGKLGALSEVLVDVGTGYFVGKPAKEACDVLRRRADLVQGQVTMLMKVLSVKQNNLEVLTNNVQVRAAQMEAAAAAAGGGEGAGSA